MSHLMELTQHHSFYEMWLNKARGKSGPLFIWGVKEDVRLINDATVETEESHAGKVSGMVMMVCNVCLGWLQ